MKWTAIYLYLHTIKTLAEFFKFLISHEHLGHLCYSIMLQFFKSINKNLCLFGFNSNIFQIEKIHSNFFYAFKADEKAYKYSFQLLVLLLVKLGTGVQKQRF